MSALTDAAKRLQEAREVRADVSRVEGFSISLEDRQGRTLYSLTKLAVSQLAVSSPRWANYLSAMAKAADEEIVAATEALNEEIGKP